MKMRMCIIIGVIILILIIVVPSTYRPLPRVTRHLIMVVNH